MGDLLVCLQERSSNECDHHSRLCLGCNKGSFFLLQALPTMPVSIQGPHKTTPPTNAGHDPTHLPHSQMYYIKRSAILHSADRIRYLQQQHMCNAAATLAVTLLSINGSVDWDVQAS